MFILNVGFLKVGEDFASDEWTANASTGCEQGPEVFRETQEVWNRGTMTRRLLSSGLSASLRVCRSVTPRRDLYVIRAEGVIPGFLLEFERMCGPGLRSTGGMGSVSGKCAIIVAKKATWGKSFT